MELKEFRLTFGQRYHRETHPVLPEASPDGYVAVMAADYDEARALVAGSLGEHWAFLYAGPFDEGEWERFYPLGCLRHLSAATVAP